MRLTSTCPPGLAQDGDGIKAPAGVFMPFADGIFQGLVRMSGSYKLP